MAEITINYLGENVEANGKILKIAAEVVRGTRVRLAPFRDDYLERLGVWIRGEYGEVLEVNETLKKKLEEKKLNVHAMPWTPVRERG